MYKILPILSSQTDVARLSGVIEADGDFITAGLKGKRYRDLIRRLGRRPRSGAAQEGGNYHSDRMLVMMSVIDLEGRKLWGRGSPLRSIAST
ncbi:MAG: hypothetical protein NXY59_01690 [Aigarchaeota archaeon]|nr:hypothetical protein [Candidatus Pelearchaeum maunauluense]